MAWGVNANLHREGDTATFDLDGDREVVVRHDGDHITILGPPPEPDAEVVNRLAAEAMASMYSGTVQWKDQLVRIARTAVAHTLAGRQLVATEEDG